MTAANWIVVGAAAGTTIAAVLSYLLRRQCRTLLDQNRRLLDEVNAAIDALKQDTEQHDGAVMVYKVAAQVFNGEASMEQLDEAVKRYEKQRGRRE